VKRLAEVVPKSTVVSCGRVADIGSVGGRVDQSSLD
jgi:hypothetical protein